MHSASLLLTNEGGVRLPNFLEVKRLVYNVRLPSLSLHTIKVIDSCQVKSASAAEVESKNKNNSVKQMHCRKTFLNF